MEKIINIVLKKSVAFTLAEMLVVMGIIGVISALTIPNLNSSTGEKEKIAKVKKLYQNFNDAAIRANAEYGPIQKWFPELNGISGAAVNKKVSDRLLEFMKVSKDCGVSTSPTACFKDNYKGLDNGDPGMKYYFGESPRTLVLADGTSVMLRVNDPSCYEDNSPNGDCAHIIADIDGTSKGPNVEGKDTFYYLLTKQGVEPFGASGQTFGSDLDTFKSVCFTRGIVCAGWVVEHDNMDYLKADSTGKCKNSDITLDLTKNFTCK